ncbi:unnamed protein product [Penicillium nalgiovense]|nr:unnamed protein product [Penicillium nalgiovense]
MQHQVFASRTLYPLVTPTVCLFHSLLPIICPFLLTLSLPGLYQLYHQFHRLFITFSSALPYPIHYQPFLQVLPGNAEVVLVLHVDVPKASFHPTRTLIPLLLTATTSVMTLFQQPNTIPAHLRMT